MVGEFDLEEHELALLREAVRTVDQLDLLAKAVDQVVINTPSGPRTHPALVEARQQRIALARILAALRIPMGEQDGPASKDSTADAAERRPQRRSGVRGVYQMRSGVG